ncbi:MAG: glycosyltransferase [Candidatus Omnitrophica bacterium]|nr:glycosyltransferase [Candidatus Omnitrophota bacterium]
MIYFVLPVFNEAENIGELVKGLRLIMKDIDYRIIAVNDGSTDDSLAILKKLKKAKDDITIENFIINMNIGAVFSTAIDSALKQSDSDDDVLVVLESDQTSELNLISSLIKEIQEKGNDVAVASRYAPGGGYRNFPMHRRVYSFCANFFLRMVFPIGSKVRDYTIFLRAYKMSVFYPLVEHFSIFGIFQTQGFIANSELLIKISMFSKKISEIPFVYDYGKKVGKSKMRIIGTINEYFVFTRYMRQIIEKSKSLRAGIDAERSD